MGELGHCCPGFVSSRLEPGAVRSASAVSPSCDRSIIEFAALDRSGTFAAVRLRMASELDDPVGMNEVTPGTSTAATQPRPIKDIVDDASLTTGLSFIVDDIVAVDVVGIVAKPRPLWLRLRLITCIRYNKHL